MRIISKEIEMIAWFKRMDMPIPIKFKLINRNESQIVKINRITRIDEEKLAGSKMYIYRCQSIFGNAEKIYELKYDVEKCRWYLYKI